MRLRRDDLVWQEVDGEVIVLDSDSSKYFRLNGTGAILWTMLDGGATHQGMVDELVESFEVDQQRALADVVVFIDALRERKLLADEE
jgi:hypothetical protein